MGHSLRQNVHLRKCFDHYGSFGLHNCLVTDQRELQPACTKQFKLLCDAYLSGQLLLCLVRYLYEPKTKKLEKGLACYGGLNDIYKNVGKHIDQ